MNAPYDAEALAAKVRRVEGLLTCDAPPSGYYHLNPEEAQIAALALSLFAHLSPQIVEALERLDMAGLA